MAPHRQIFGANKPGGAPMSLTRRGLLTRLGAMFAAATMTQLGGCNYIVLGTGRMVSAGGRIATGETFEGQTLGQLLEELVEAEDLADIRGLAIADGEGLELIEDLNRDTPLPAGLRITFRYPRAAQITIASEEAGWTVKELKQRYGDDVVVINSGFVVTNLTDDDLIYPDDWLCIRPSATTYRAAT